MVTIYYMQLHDWSESVGFVGCSVERDALMVKTCIQSLLVWCFNADEYFLTCCLFLYRSGCEGAEVNPWCTDNCNKNWKTELLVCCFVSTVFSGHNTKIINWKSWITSCCVIVLGIVCCQPVKIGWVMVFWHLSTRCQIWVVIGLKSILRALPSITHVWR